MKKREKYEKQDYFYLIILSILCQFHHHLYMKTLGGFKGNVTQSMEFQKQDIKDDILSAESRESGWHTLGKREHGSQSLVIAKGTKVHPEDVPNSTTRIFHRGPSL